MKNPLDIQIAAQAKIGHELIFKIINIRLCADPIKTPNNGANCAIFLNFGLINGNFGKTVKNIQAPAKLLK